VISPLLANIYLHEVLDQWVEHTVKPRMRGEITLVRFADDFVVCFQYSEDAEKFQRVLPKRFGKYGLELHPEKTRLIEFGWSAWGRSKRDGTKLETFNFLGFTFYCSESREGRFTVKSKTMSKRLRRGLNPDFAIGRWIRRTMSDFFVLKKFDRRQRYALTFFVEKASTSLVSSDTPIAKYGFKIFLQAKNEIQKITNEIRNIINKKAELREKTIEIVDGSI